MPTGQLVRQSLERLERSILGDDYAGFDPYDILMSPVFRLPILRKNRAFRFSAQQLFRRIPVNLRPLLGIRKGVNPVTLGLCLSAYANLLWVFPQKRDLYRKEIASCVNRLCLLRSPGYSGACWGYEFDWEARYAGFPAFTPTIVATGSVVNGLYAVHNHLDGKTVPDLLASAAEFVLRDLNRTWDGDTFCFSYSPHDSQVVFNATAKAARLLAQAFTVTSQVRHLNEAKGTVEYLCNHQQKDGRWGYSLGDARKWSDNFHTGYVLDCLHEYSRISGDQSILQSLERGFVFYRSRFFTCEGVPRYYHDRTYPVDSCSGAQSILTLMRFGDHDMAHRVARWMITNMQDPRGFFYYRRHRCLRNRMSYMRWSNAWMYLALSTLLRGNNALV